MDMRSVVRAGAWVVGGLMLMVTLAATMIVVINWRDEAPSRHALELDRLLDARPASRDDDNGFVLALGMAAPVGEDPLALGLERQAFLAGFSSTRAVSDFPGKEEDYSARRSKTVADLAGACSRGAAPCLRELESSPAGVDAWLESEAWLLERYRLLIRRPAWRESVPSDLRAPMPPYQHMLEGQRLHLLDAWRAARSGDPERARVLIDADMRFWRMMLASSDLLISKMIATAGVRRNLVLGSLALRETVADEATDLPSSWTAPLAAEERSLRRALAGEWRFSRRAVEAIAGPDAELDFAAREQGVHKALVRPLYKRQATANLFADVMTRVAEVSELPHAELARSLADLETARESAGWSLYNPVGRMLVAIGGEPVYRDYVARVADLEALRATALLAAGLRKQGGRSGARAAVEQSRDPYGEPFVWDEATDSLSFKPLQRHPSEERSILL